MDSSEFVERHRQCGGKIVEIETRRSRCYFVPWPKGSKPKTKRCNQCGQFPKTKDIVPVRPGEILGWTSI